MEKIMVSPYSFFVVLIAVLNLVRSANILALFPLPANSHFRVYQVLLERLAERGHNVDVLSHFPRALPCKGYVDLSVRNTVEFISHFPVEPIKSYTTIDILNLLLDSVGPPLCKTVTNTTVAQQLMKSDKKYDVIIAEMFISDSILGYAHLFRAPLIAMASSVTLPWSCDFIGMPDNPSYIPSYFSPYSEEMNYFERLHNALTLYIGKIWYHFFAMKESNKAIRDIFGINSVHVKEILKNVSLLMVNTHFSLHQSRPMTPNFIEIGGIHIKENPVLPVKYEEHLRTDLEGVVFLSFGTYLDSVNISQEHLTALFGALSEVPYKILWKGNISDVSKLISVPKNVYFVPWLPQVEVLCHPNLKLFITHSGQASIQEAAYCAKPILAIPVWADQITNAKMVVSKGIGLMIPFFEVTKEKMSEALKELLANTKYAENAKRLSELFRDRPMSPMDTAVYWTEYVVRHKGAAHLRSKAADLPWYIYCCFDIIVFLCIVSVLSLLLLYKFVLFLLYKVFKSGQDSVLNKFKTQ